MEIILLLACVLVGWEVCENLVFAGFFDRKRKWNNFELSSLSDVMAIIGALAILSLAASIVIALWEAPR
jgi:hypothetical protein